MSTEQQRKQVEVFLGPLATGIRDRAVHNEAGRRTTLERLNAAAEAQKP